MKKAQQVKTGWRRACAGMGLALALAAATLVACGGGTPGDTNGNCAQACLEDNECGAGQGCTAGCCRAPADAGPEPAAPRAT